MGSDPEKLEQLNEGMVWEITPYQDTSGELTQRPEHPADVFAPIILTDADAVRAYNSLTPEERLTRNRATTTALHNAVTGARRRAGLLPL